MSGFGVAPCGVCIMGIGAPSDPSTIPDGTTQVSRWLDPVSGDYQISTAGGQLRQMSAVLQRVIITIRTRVGSSLAATGFGTKFPKKQMRNLQADVESIIRRVFRQMTDVEQVMRIDSVVVQSGGGRVLIELHYTNLQTGESDKIPVTIWP
jgi:hypothetical protein